MPKNICTKFMIAQAAKTITSPIKAAVIWFLAASVWALSPPDVMYLIPPQTSMKKKTKAATIRIKIMTAETIFAIEISLSPENCPPGVKLIPCARTVESIVMLASYHYADIQNPLSRGNFSLDFLIVFIKLKFFSIFYVY